MNTQLFMESGHTLTPLEDEAFVNEGDLQKLVAKRPELLAGMAGLPSALRLIKREQGVTSAEGTINRFRVDHLFVDQAGVLTLVEVKKADNRELRRQVVAQMLDYAANGPSTWDIEQLRADFAASCAELDSDPDQEISEFSGMEADAFWKQVQDKIAAKSMRLIFVANEIPASLRRIVDFLNDQMKQTEVLGVEVKRYTAAKTRVITATLVGEPVAQRTGQTEEIDEMAFYQGLAAKAPDARPGAERLVAWAENESEIEVTWTESEVRGGAVHLRSKRPGTPDRPLHLSDSGVLYIHLKQMLELTPFPGGRDDEMVKRLENALGPRMPKDPKSHWVAVSLADLSKEGKVKPLIDVLDWYWAQTEQPFEG